MQAYALVVVEKPVSIIAKTCDETLTICIQGYITVRFTCSNHGDRTDSLGVVAGYHVTWHNYNKAPHGEHIMGMCQNEVQHTVAHV